MIDYKPKPKPLKIGVFTAGTAPFVIRDGDKYSGISIDIWEKIAEELNLKYEYIYAGNDKQTAFDKLSDKKFDLLIGNYQLTEHHLQKADFSIPFYISDIAIVTKNPSYTSLSMSKFFTVLKLIAISLTVVVLILVAQTFVEKYNFQKNIFSTLTNVLYNFIFNFQTIPQKFAKKTYLFLYCIIAICIFFINFILNKKNIADISDKKLLFRKNSGFDSYIKKSNSRPIPASIKITSDPHLQRQNNSLLNYYKNSSKYDGVVDDSAVLGYVLNQNHSKYKELYFDSNTLGIFSHSFVIPKKSKLTTKLNSSLAKLQEEKITQIIVSKYLGRNFEKNASF